MTEKKRIITTSWDDGHPLDERLHALLGAYGIAATFYIPDTGPRTVMDLQALRRLHTDGAEIGGHTVHHARLRGLSDQVAFAEIADNRQHLRDSLGTPITSFCYPCGEFSSRTQTLAQKAGYTRARTTMGLRVDAAPDPFRLPVTAQIFPHGRFIHGRHALKEGNFAGLIQWATWGSPALLETIVDRALSTIEHHGGILHLWGHSWELEEANLWMSLTQVLKLIAKRPGFSYLTNAQAYP